MRIDGFNIFNNSAITAWTQTFGVKYQQVTNILTARIVQLGATLDF